MNNVVTSSIRLLIVDDHTLFRRGLRQACELEPSFEVIGEAGNGQEAVELAGRLQPDVVLMDIEMPLMDGVQATRAIVQVQPATRVLVLTAFERDEYVFRAIRVGASGYLLKGVDEAGLIWAIRTVYRRGVLIDPYVAGRLLQEFSHRPPPDLQSRSAEPVELEQLTEGEMAVLRLVAQGEVNQAICHQLNLAEKTVTNRLSAIYEKLHVNSRVQATLYALRKGWVPLEPE
jgi:DNA-binding NarL/FixJ family response regulator